MPSDYYYEIENRLIDAGTESRASLSRVMESVDKSKLTQREYDELHNFYERLWDAVGSNKKKKELYSDFDYANLSRGGDLTDD